MIKLNGAQIREDMKLVEQALNEAKTPDWMLKKVKNPKTGNMVQVRSLDPKEWDKYRPKDRLSKKHVKALAAHHKLGDWTVRGSSLHHKSSGKNVKVDPGAGHDVLVKAMGGGSKESMVKKDQDKSDEIMNDPHVSKAVGILMDLSDRSGVDVDGVLDAIQSGEEVDWIGLNDDALDNAATEKHATSYTNMINKAELELAKYQGSKKNDEDDEDDDGRDNDDSQ